MASQDRRSVDVRVENLGGIDSEELHLEQGVTLLTGRNATNRTSLLRSVAAGLGGSAGQLKGDAATGEVTLELDGTTYTRQFERTDGGVVTDGDPYTDEQTLADLYSCLLEDNRARRAVERDDADALREVIMAPVDTGEITAEIDAQQREIRSLENDLEEIEAELDRLPGLERRLNERQDELAEVRAALESVREAVESVEPDADDLEAAEDAVAELKETRDEFETVRNRLDTQRAALESIREERSELDDELEAMEERQAELDDAKSELERLQRRRREVESTINSLLSIVEFNEELLAGESDEFSEETDVVEALDPSTETITCWTCGTAVERSSIDGRLDDLRSVIDEKREERNELGTEIDELRDTVQELREQKRERDRLERERTDLDAEIEERERRIADLSDRKEALQGEIESLEQAVAESEQVRDEGLAEQYQQLSELEYERGQLEESIASIEAEIESIESLREERERVEGELDDRRDQLASLRDRVDDLERTAVETFNEHVETLLAHLEYENIERVWIERKESDDGATEGSSFDLHVVRSDETGTVYEDRIGHLSESEREVIGLVVALAGYLVHDVHETVPVMLLDSLEAIDADRIAALVEYFADYAPFLVVALLPEDAQALPEEYDRIHMGRALA